MSMGPAWDDHDRAKIEQATSRLLKALAGENGDYAVISAPDAGLTPPRR
jgi:hypothetical protein